MFCEDHVSFLSCFLGDCFLMFMVMSLFLSVHVVVIQELVRNLYCVVGLLFGGWVLFVVVFNFISDMFSCL